MLPATISIFPLRYLQLWPPGDHQATLHKPNLELDVDSLAYA
jgi:hypothetical protein